MIISISGDIIECCVYLRFDVDKKGLKPLVIKGEYTKSCAQSYIIDKEGREKLRNWLIKYGNGIVDE